MAIELKHLSASSLSTYLLCPHAWRLHYVDRVPSKGSPAMTFGRAVHTALEMLLRSKVAGQMVDAQGAWEHAWSLASEEPTEWGSELPEQFQTDGARLFAAPAVLQLVDEIRPLVHECAPILEHKVELRVPGVPIPVIGYADMVRADMVPCDFKTSSRAWGSGKAEAEIQPLIYLAALNQMGWKLPSLAFCHYVLVKGRSVQVQKVETTYRPAQVFGVIETVQQVWAGIQAGCFPYNTSGWKHDEKYCDHWQRCLMGGKR